MLYTNDTNIGPWFKDESINQKNPKPRISLEGSPLKTQLRNRSKIGFCLSWTMTSHLDKRPSRNQITLKLFKSFQCIRMKFVFRIFLYNTCTVFFNLKWFPYTESFCNVFFIMLLSNHYLQSAPKEKKSVHFKMCVKYKTVFNYLRPLESFSERKNIGIWLFNRRSIT